MKKLISMLVLAALVMSLGLAAVGCKSSGTDSGETGSFIDAIPGGSADVSVEVLNALADSGTISTYIFGDGVTPESDSVISRREKFDAYYDQVYNGKVDYEHIVWEKWEDTYVTKFAANDNADLIYLFEKNFPKYTNREMVYSIEELTEMGVVGFDHPRLTENRDLVYERFAYNGEHYAFATNSAEADMIFVNEDLFDTYEVKSPTEYYEEGVWNWETFEKCAKELTRDTDNDGASDVFGYYGWDGNFIVNAAGGELVILNDDGTLEVGIESSQVIQGLENYANIFGRLKCAAEVGFGTGKLGMIAWMPSNEVKYFVEGDNQYTFNWGMVPFPLDTRTNSDGIRSGKCSGWTISTTCDNPQGCVNYMIALLTFAEIDRNPNKIYYEDVFTQEQLDMINDCTRQAVVPIYQGVGTLWSSQWDFWYQLRKGTAASEIVATYKSLFEAQVELENNYSSK